MNQQSFQQMGRNSPEAIPTEMRRIEGREWWLLGFAVAVTLALTLGIISFTFPWFSRETDASYWFDLREWGQRAKSGGGYRSNCRTGERPFAQYWPFPASPCRRAVNQKGRELSRIKVVVHDAHVGGRRARRRLDRHLVVARMDVAVRDGHVRDRKRRGETKDAE